LLGPLTASCQPPETCAVSGQGHTQSKGIASVILLACMLRRIVAAEKYAMLGKSFEFLPLDGCDTIGKHDELIMKNRAIYIDETYSVWD
jgi:hypothetical protein